MHKFSKKAKNIIEAFNAGHSQQELFNLILSELSVAHNAGRCLEIDRQLKQQSTTLYSLHELKTLWEIDHIEDESFMHWLYNHYKAEYDNNLSFIGFTKCL